MTGQSADIRVLHLVASTDRRGAETSAIELSRALDGLGCPGSVYALAPGRTGGLDLATLGPSRFSAATLRSLRSAAADHDVVVAHGSSTLPATAAATVGVPTPFVYRSVGDPLAWATTPSRRLRVGAAARRAATVVALWRGSAIAWHTVLGVAAERIDVIPNGVPAHRFPMASAADRARARDRLGLAHETPVALYLGALSKEKRVDVALAAVSLLENVTLAVVGEGPERRPLEELASPLGGKARFFGATDEPWNALAAADLLVLPSDTEGQPAVAVEAGLVGLPVVATRVGGLPEVVIDGRTGILVGRDDESALAAAIREAIDRGEEFGFAAREHCSHRFGIDGIARRWVGRLQSIITS